LIDDSFIIDSINEICLILI